MERAGRGRAPAVIHYVRGTVAARDASRVVVETAGGLGLEVWVPASTSARLPEPGRPVKLYTHLAIREDSWQLAGFLTMDERDVFLALLGVNGVGLKVSLAVLGQIKPDGVRAAVAGGDWKGLTRVSGVGPKLAQRLVVELRGVLAEGPAEVPRAASPPPPPDEVVDGLLALGYTGAEAAWAVEGAPPEPVAVRLREALRRLDSRKGMGGADADRRDGGP